MKTALGYLLLSLSFATLADSPVNKQPDAGYVVDSKASRVDLEAIQTGSVLRTAFNKVSGTMQFSPESFDNAKLDLVFDPSSMEVNEADAAVAKKVQALLEPQTHASARYVAHRFGLSDAGYAAYGTLTLHGVSRDEVPVFFTFVENDGTFKFRGTTRIRPYDFGIGSADENGKPAISNTAKLRFNLSLVPTK